LFSTQWEARMRSILAVRPLWAAYYKMGGVHRAKHDALRTTDWI